MRNHSSPADFHDAAVARQRYFQRRRRSPALPPPWPCLDPAAQPHTKPLSASTTAERKVPTPLVGAMVSPTLIRRRNSAVPPSLRPAGCSCSSQQAILLCTWLTRAGARPRAATSASARRQPSPMPCLWTLSEPKPRSRMCVDRVVLTACDVVGEWSKLA